MTTMRVVADREVSRQSLSIALVASMMYRVSEPFAGGMEALTHDLASGLRARDHAVDVLDGSRSDPVALSPQSRRDVSWQPEAVVQEHHAYLDVMLSLSKRVDVDLVHASCVHHLPLAMSTALGVAFTMTLHCPPTAWLESAITLARHRSRLSPFVAVSRSVRDAWAHADLEITVIPNGIDVSTWRPGFGGGGYAMWWGRIVPEKGVEDAIEAAHLAGMNIVLAGPRHDPDYFESMVGPRLLAGDEWVGHLTRSDLVEIVGRADVSIISPRWDEPFGLVAAESLACGTPVATYRRGGLVEFIDDEVGATATPDDIVALANAAIRARSKNRAAARRRAVAACSLEAMLDGYERHYERVLDD